jgi:hypothetical protein
MGLGAVIAMTPHEVCADCRKWIQEEAEGLSEEPRQRVLRALEEKHERLCCNRLLELQDHGDIPAFWNATLEKFWEYSG